MPRGVTGQSDREFYTGLARRLREANRVGTERARPHQEKQIAEGGVPLADMLDLLTSKDGAQLLTALEQESESAVAELNANLDKHGASSMIGASLSTGLAADAFYPRDPFRKRLAQFFEHRDFGSPRHDKEAVAAAVVKTFSVLTSPTGVVTKETAGMLGPRALAVLEAMRTRLDEVGGAPRSARPASKIEDLWITDLARIGRSRRVPDAKARMPVLDEVSRMIGSPAALKSFTMASVQHLFPSTRGLYKALGDNGLAHASTGVGGKGYSTDVDTMMRLAAEGFDVHMDGRPMAHAEAASNAEEVVLAMARDELGALFVGLSPDQARAETKPRFLLLDEGAKLIKALHLYYPQYAHLCVCVEQTDRGVQIIEEGKKKRAEERAVFEQTGQWPKPRQGFELRCAVVNMARSEAKKQGESPMIGESCVFNLEKQLADMHPELDARLFPPGTKREACVIGYGAVGKAVADQLRLRGYDVHVYDKDPAKMAQAARDGCVTEAREQALAHGKLLYGCTGQTILRPADYDLLPDGAVLANAASGNHELGLHDVHFDTMTRDDAAFRGLDVNLGESVDPMRHRVMKTPGGKEVLLARSGYVVNMGLDLPPEYAQLTRSLLLASCLTAVKHGETKGFVEIPADVQQFIVGRVKHYLKAQSASLDKPDFRDLQPWG